MNMAAPSRLKYRIHQGVIMAFRDGKPLRASLLHRWKVIMVPGKNKALERLDAIQANLKDWVAYESGDGPKPDYVVP